MVNPGNLKRPVTMTPGRVRVSHLVTASITYTLETLQCDNIHAEQLRRCEAQLHPIGQARNLDEGHVGARKRHLLQALESLCHQHD